MHDTHTFGRNGAKVLPLRPYLSALSDMGIYEDLTRWDGCHDPQRTGEPVCCRCLHDEDALSLDLVLLRGLPKCEATSDLRFLTERAQNRVLFDLLVISRQIVARSHGLRFKGHAVETLEPSLGGNSVPTKPYVFNVHRSQLFKNLKTATPGRYIKTQTIPTGSAAAFLS